MDIKNLSEKEDSNDKGISKSVSGSSKIGQWILFICLVFIVIALFDTKHSSKSQVGVESNRVCGVFFNTGFLHISDTLIEINFPNSIIENEWDRYDNQRICITGNIREKKYSSGHDKYIVDNPQFIGYAN